MKRFTNMYQWQKAGMILQRFPGGCTDFFWKQLQNRNIRHWLQPTEYSLNQNESVICWEDMLLCRAR